MQTEAGPRETVADHWAEYERRVVPAQAGRAQRNDMRHSFYAGALACMSMAWKLAESDLDAGTKKLSAIHDELIQYGKDLEASVSKARP